MSTVASLDVQTALVTLLRGNTSIRSALNGASPNYAIYDEVRPGTLGNYIVVGEGAETDSPYFGEDAQTVLAHVEIWTQDGETESGSSGAAGYKKGLEIAKLVTDALYTTGLTISGRTATVLRKEEIERQRLPANEQGPAYRVVVPKFVILVEG